MLERRRVRATGREHKGFALALLCLIAFLAVSLPLVVLGPSARALALALIGLVLVSVAAQGLLAGLVDPFEPRWLFLCVFAVDFWLKPLLILGGDESLLLSYLPYAEESLTPATVYALVGVAGFWLGYCVLGAFRLMPAPRFLDGSVSRVRLNIALPAAGAVFSAVVFYFLWKGGFDLTYIFQNRAAQSASDGDLSFLVHILAWYTVVLAFMRFHGPSRGLRSHRWAVLLGVIGFVGLLMTTFGSRASVLFVLLGSAVLIHYTVRRVSMWSAMLAFGGFFLVASLFGAFRGQMNLEGTGDLVASAIKDEIKGYADWDILAASVATYPGVRPYYYGQLSREAFYLLVPRRIWSSKPEWYGPQRMQEDIAPGLLSSNPLGGFVGTSISQSFIGEAYAEFGFLGIVLGTMFYGTVWRLVHQSVKRSNYSLASVVVFAPLFTYIPLSLRGLSGVIVHLLMWTVASYLLILVMRSGASMVIVRRSTQREMSLPPQAARAGFRRLV